MHTAQALGHQSFSQPPALVGGMRAHRLKVAFAVHLIQPKDAEGGNPILINGQGQMMDATTKEILGPGSKIVDVKTGLLSDESRKARAIQLSMGDIKSAYAGFGYGDNINKKNVYDDAIKLLVDQGGMTVGQAAKYLSEQSQEWQSRGVGMSAEARTAGTREANLGIILKATDAAIPAALEEIGRAHV